jgi:pimeloyl-ACP methyl ester carboxylesterase
MTIEPRRTFLKTSGLAGASAMAGLWSRSRVLAQGAASTVGRMVDTPTLSIGYEDTGDPRGFPIILLHGFPDDVHAFDEVVPPLVRAGHRALVPYLRGYGPTRFRDASAPRMAEQAAIGQDVIDFADALQLPRFALAGYDWGGRGAGGGAGRPPPPGRARVGVAAPRPPPPHGRPSRNRPAQIAGAATRRQSR